MSEDVVRPVFACTKLYRAMPSSLLCYALADQSWQAHRRGLSVLYPGGVVVQVTTGEEMP